VAACVEVHTGTLESLWPRIPESQLIVVNILAQIVIELTPRLAQKLLPGGYLISSGILAEQANDVEATMRGAGLAVVERRAEGDWVAFISRLGSKSKA